MYNYQKETNIYISCFMTKVAMPQFENPPTLSFQHGQIFNHWPHSSQMVINGKLKIPAIH